MTPPLTWANDIEAAKTEDDKTARGTSQHLCRNPHACPIEEGDIQARLAAAIEKNDTDLVVIGTRGRNGLGKLLLGSVAEDIFRTVSCPVLTVGPHSGSSHGPSVELREILYATHLSPESEGGAAYAISLAEEFQSA